MGVYARFKKNREGLRQLVELIESTPKARRQKLIDVGMAEDAKYTELALKYIITFEDILKMNNLELAELVAKAPPRTIAFAIKKFDKDVILRFLQCSQPRVMAAIKDDLEVEVGMAEIGSAQLKMITIARDLEKQGKLNLKKIPLSE